MIKVGILSDTHSDLSPKVLEFFASCNEIWHAGDIGAESVIQQLSKVAHVRAVYGNIDGAQIRSYCPEFQLFTVEKVKVLMTHIGGYPKKYQKEALRLIKSEKPNLFISGHSHILKVVFDHDFNVLHINPGAAGKFGFHQVSTAIRMDIDGSDFKNLEILEFQK